MQPGQCLHRRCDVRIPGHLVERNLKLKTQPRRRLRHGDVHREVDQTRLSLGVAVMTEVDRGHAEAPVRRCRCQNTRALTQVIANIAAMP